jgi:two-component system phosphate regulon sensor histidine kinase PhoR
VKKSILIKVYGSYVLLLLTLTALFLLLSFRTVRKHYLNTFVRDLERLGQSLMVQVDVFLDEARYQDMEQFLTEKGRQISTRLTVINPEGVVLADSEKDPATMESHRFRPEVYDALQGRLGHSLRYSSTVKQDMLYVALPIDRGGRIEGALRLSLFVSDVDMLLGALRGDMVRAGIIILILALLGAFVFSRNLTRPIREMIRASRRVKAGDFEARVRIQNRDEWRELAQTFNSMTGEIKRLFADLRRRKEEIDNIIASMDEGILVLDKNDKILLVNESSARLIGQTFLEGKFYWEVVRTTPFVELIRKVKDEKKSSLAEIVFGQRNVLCRASYLASQDGIVATFHDITEMQNLAQMKRDFVLNVSHELRTPLTAIRGYAETLGAGVDEKNKAYTVTILKHTDRLIRIVEDLLTLAALEEKGPGLEVETVNLAELAENILKIFELRARDKGIIFRLVVDAEPPTIRGDSFRLEQMLVNLIDNAIKYTEKGHIEVGLRSGEGSLILRVSDSGIGIPAEDQSRIFERFYVVDKSRSRKLGGTGLGLSIVKHIVLLHGGKIHLESTPGVGTTFTVVLPRQSA